MRFALMIEPQQGLSYEEQLAIALRAETAGFETLFRSDHYSDTIGGGTLPSTDTWAVLAGLARETARIGLGSLMSPITFRAPGNLAKLVVTVDEMSGGRVELGLGAGWQADEHRRHGLPFPEIGERAERLEETLEILHGLWEGPDGWSFLGRHYAVEDARFRPKPATLPGRHGGRPNLIVGGQGTARSFRIAARHADEFNLSSASPQVAAQKLAALDETLRAAGRDPSSLVHSAMVGTLIGRDRDEVRRREVDLLAMLGAGDAGEAWFEPRRSRWIHGTPDEARATVAQYAEVGVQRLVLQDFVPRDLEMIDLAAETLFGD
ncbi:MAG: TIGR03560 family F420-dependent LLM class oxidoreductase [Candidatus Limnocylindrales bacterium]